EVRHDNRCDRHQKLEKVRLGAFVGLARQPVQRGVPHGEDDEEQGDRDREPCRPMPQGRSRWGRGPHASDRSDRETSPVIYPTHTKGGAHMAKLENLTVTPFLWFDDQAEEAAKFYASIFPNSRITEISRDPSGTAAKPGKALTVSFTLAGQDFIALNGGPQFKFDEAISFSISCDTQEEVDELWTELGAGGSEGQCGWIKDRYGLWWQVVPRALGDALQDRDPQRAKRAMDAMLK